MTNTGFYPLFDSFNGSSETIRKTTQYTQRITQHTQSITQHTQSITQSYRLTHTNTHTNTNTHTLTDITDITETTETLNGEVRRFPFHFAEYEKELPEHKTRIDQSFLEWFIGFSEGDGSFLISPAQDSPQSPEPQRLFFTITQKEPQVLHWLRSIMGFGKVTAHGDDFRYTVADLESLDRLIYIFNGNLILDKTNARFAAWVKARNIIHARGLSIKSSNPPIDLLETFPVRMMKERQKLLETVSETEKESILLLSFIPFSRTAWLSGFIDAEGCFNITKIRRPSKNTYGFRIRCRFILDQQAELATFEEIRKDINGGYIILRTGKSIAEEMYRYECGSFADLNTIKSYLEKYPLKSRKRFAAVRLFKMLFYLENRRTLPWTGKVLERIERLIARNEEDDTQDETEDD